MLDYATLKLLWWGLIGFLLVGFTIMDGHDLGVGIALPWLGKNDTERRVLINTIAPHWDGNQVWLITAGGAIFAAWPVVYAVAFSGLYTALLLVLFTLMIRPVALEYRSKLESLRWRQIWDWGIFLGSAVPALVFGVAFGNLFLGVPFRLDASMRTYYSGSFWALLSPLALLFGVVSFSLIGLQGSGYLVHRTAGQLKKRSRQASFFFAVVLLTAFSLAGLWVSQIPGYTLSALPDVGISLTPLMKTVNTSAGAWFSQYHSHPLLWWVPAGVYLCVLSALLAQHYQKSLWGFVLTSTACALVLLTAAIGLFPFILPSSSHPDFSLTLWDASSSQKVLNIMLWVAVIFTPLIVLYTSWAYRTMAGTLDEAYVNKNDRHLY